MERLEFEGGTYCDATDRDHVALIWDQRIETSRGVRPLFDGSNVIQLRISRDGVRFAGSGQSGEHNDMAIEWINNKYELRGRAAAQRSCIYDAGGQLIIARGNNTADIYSASGELVTTINIPSGSQGIRYLREGDGFPITSDDSNVHPRRVWQYTERGRFVVGQSSKGRYGEDALIVVEVLPDGSENRFVLSKGTNRFVNFYLYGELLVIAWWHESAKKARVWRLHASELENFERQLPEDVVVPGGGPMEMPEDVYNTYAAVEAKFPNGGTDDERREANRKAVATVRARHGGRWVCKSEHNLGWGSDSKDALAFVPEGTPQHGAKMKMHMWDMVTSGGDLTGRHDSPEAREAYVLIPEAKDWLAGTGPVDPPPPDDSTHRYIGGGNDTGTCDQCGKPRMDPIHRVPEGKKPHEPWLGEDEKGDCDLCFLPVDDPIHTAEPTDPDVPTDPDNPPNPAQPTLVSVMIEIRNVLREIRDKL